MNLYILLLKTDYICSQLNLTLRSEGKKKERKGKRTTFVSFGTIGGSSMI